MYVLLDLFTQNAYFTTRKYKKKKIIKISFESKEIIIFKYYVVLLLIIFVNTFKNK